MASKRTARGRARHPLCEVAQRRQTQGHGLVVDLSSARHCPATKLAMLAHEGVEVGCSRCRDCPEEHHRQQLQHWQRHVAMMQLFGIGLSQPPSQTTGRRTQSRRRQSRSTIGPSAATACRLQQLRLVRRTLLRRSVDAARCRSCGLGEGCHSRAHRPVAALRGSVRGHRTLLRLRMGHCLRGFRLCTRYCQLAY